MNRKQKTPMWARLKASKQRASELELLLCQQEKRLLDETKKLTRVLVLLERSVSENVALKKRLRALQALANETEV